MVIIRKYRNSDRQSLINLWLEVFPDDPPHNAPAIVIDAKLAVDDLIFVAEAEVEAADTDANANTGQLLGACIAGYDGHRGWLYAVAVRQTRRRDGTGSALVNHAIQSLKSIGCKKVNLQIRSTNTEVAAFYKALGFATEDRLSMGVHLE